jgi:hypothetical protein
MKTNVNTMLLVIMGIIGTGLVSGLTSGQIQMPDYLRPYIGLMVVPALVYIVSQLPARGTEDLVDLSAKIGSAEAVDVLRAYLHNKAQAGTGLSVAVPQPNTAPTPSTTEPQAWEVPQADPNEPPPEWLPKR